MADPNPFDIDFDKAVALANSGDLGDKWTALQDSFVLLKDAKTNPRIFDGLKPHHIGHLRQAGKALEAAGITEPSAMLEFHLRELNAAVPASRKLGFLFQPNPAPGMAPAIRP
jgi:hypothetical protein